jgi:hypothetical protein
MNDNVLFKNLTTGATIHALIKGDNMRYSEGSIVSVGQPRIEMPTSTSPAMAIPAMPKNVVDVTYSLEGKNYTDAIDVNASMHATDKPGATTLLATDKATILRELRATLKIDEDYLAHVDDEKTRREKSVAKCRELIGMLDTEYAEKQAFEQRIQSLEHGQSQTNAMLQQIIDKLNSK